mmetsp:Transcript_19262/g.40623  ORF Transcript_19262/g.40623 Transcript_19262/m.40623 type:complete len:183 (+) Transcript_19262:89-637(+)
MKAYNFVLHMAIFAVTFGYANAATNLFDFRKIWLKRPYNGPEVVVEIVGVDICPRANRYVDRWSHPDTYVTIKHGKIERRTQIEPNTYKARFLCKTKMPHHKKYGMRFVVTDANVIIDDEVIGRAFIDKDRIVDMMRTGEPALLSLGENIGIVKVSVTAPPKDLREKGFFQLTSTVKPLDAP